MKRAIFGIILMLALLLTSCIDRKEYQQRITKVEQEVNKLSAEVDTIKTEAQPRVMEKDVIVKSPFDTTFDKDKGWLPFTVKAHTRVEGEVSRGSKLAVALVKDPYGNTIVSTDGVTSYREYYPNRGFPWKFAFIAPTDGEYVLQIWTSLGADKSLVNLKVTVYDR